MTKTKLADNYYKLIASNVISCSDLEEVSSFINGNCEISEDLTNKINLIIK